MSKKFWAAIGLAASFLSGCGKDVPSDKLSAEVVRPFAEAHVKGIEVADFKRDNGWVDTQAPNRYIVQYKYNLKLAQPAPEVVLGLAKDIRAEFDETRKNPGFMGVAALQASLDLRSEADEWINVQGDKFAARRDGFLKNCAKCLDYWNAVGAEDEANIRRTVFTVAWRRFENLGFSDAAAVGDKSARTAWAAFIKTEKGWAAAGG